MMCEASCFQKLCSALERQSKTAPEIEKAAVLIRNAILEDRLIHVFGTEQLSAALAADLFFRAGALKHINPILDPTLAPAHGAYRNAMCMEIDNLAPCILDYYEYVDAGDPILLIGSDAKLPMFASALQWAQNKQLKAIAMACRNTDAIQGADVVIPLEECTYQGDGYMSLAAAVLEQIVSMVKTDLPDLSDYVWSGERTVDLQANSEGIDRMLYRVRHL